LRRQLAFTSPASGAVEKASSAPRPNPGGFGLLADRHAWGSDSAQKERLSRWKKSHKACDSLRPPTRPSCKSKATQGDVSLWVALLRLCDNVHFNQ